MKIEGQGVTLDIPDGWQGKVEAMELGGWKLHAGNFGIPADDDALGTVAASRLGGDDVFVTVFDLGPLPREWITEETGWLVSDGPIAISKSDFGSFEGITAPSYALRPVFYHGHALEVGVGFGTANPNNDDLDRANKILATLAVPPPLDVVPVVGTEQDEALAAAG